MNVNLDIFVKNSTVSRVVRACVFGWVTFLVLFFAGPLQAFEHEMTIRVIESDDFDTARQLSLPPRGSRRVQTRAVINSTEQDQGESGAEHQKDESDDGKDKPEIEDDDPEERDREDDHDSRDEREEHDEDRDHAKEEQDEIKDDIEDAKDEEDDAKEDVEDHRDEDEPEEAEQEDAEKEDAEPEPVDPPEPVKLPKL